MARALAKQQGKRNSCTQCGLAVRRRLKFRQARIEIPAKRRAQPCPPKGQACGKGKRRPCGHSNAVAQGMVHQVD